MDHLAIIALALAPLWVLVGYLLRRREIARAMDGQERVIEHLTKVSERAHNKLLSHTLSDYSRMEKLAERPVELAKPPSREDGVFDRHGRYTEDELADLSPDPLARR